MREKCDVLIVGGGFFGLVIAEHFARGGSRVVVCERESACMTRASYVNQARIHNGYHYPRSILTALRSRVSFPRFVREFPDCVVSDFAKYYAIGKILGKVTARQFWEFCRRIGAECEEAEPSVAHMFNEHYIEKVFRVREYAFDSSVLCKMMLERTARAGVEIRLSSEVCGFGVQSSGCRFNVSVRDADGEYQLEANQIFNCTYSNLNMLNSRCSLPLIPLKYEMTEMALVSIPEEMKGKAFTIMCGPFFSIMPFPTKGLYSLSHVRYTPHYEWNDQNGRYVSPLERFELDPKITAFPSMYRDAARYLPAVAKCEYRESIWEVKTVLPSSEVDDSRPILFKPDYGIKGYHCVMGGKIDNVYDVICAIERDKGRFA